MTRKTSRPIAPVTPDPTAPFFKGNQPLKYVFAADVKVGDRLYIDGYFFLVKDVQTDAYSHNTQIACHQAHRRFTFTERAKLSIIAPPWPTGPATPIDVQAWLDTFSEPLDISAKPAPPTSVNPASLARQAALTEAAEPEPTPPARFQLAAELENVFECLTYEFSRRRFAMIVRAVQREINATPAQIVDFINGGVDGWDVSIEGQQDYYDRTSVQEIASWASDCMYACGGYTRTGQRPYIKNPTTDRPQ